MRENTTYTHNKKKRATHPSWDIRIRFIEEGIEPTLEQVTKEFNEYYEI